MLSKEKKIFQKYIFCALIYTILVILWGAFVRISFSGDGCGDHWPLCNGEMLPSLSSSKTIVEWTHRITSMLAWWLVLGGCFLARRHFPARHLVRKGAYLTFFLMCTEALVGAGLVLFKMVAHNESIARGWWVSTHLINTFLLLGAFTFTLWASIKQDRIFTADYRRWFLPVCMVALLLLSGVSGAIAALGDTLFPISDLAASGIKEAIAQDFDPASHLFIRLRVWHPIIALSTAAVSSIWLIHVAQNSNTQKDRKWIFGLLGLFVLQISLGFLNVLLMAPSWIQIIHLFIADLIWIQTIWWILESCSSSVSIETVDS